MDFLVGESFMMAMRHGWLLSPDGAHIPASIIWCTCSSSTPWDVNFLMLRLRLIDSSMMHSPRTALCGHEEHKEAQGLFVKRVQKKRVRSLPSTVFASLHSLLVGEGQTLE
jgi:hypothetical protein